MMLTIHNLKLTIQQNKLSGINFVTQKIALKQSAPLPHLSFYEEIEKYFQNPAHRFNLPLQLAGTAFQMKVWKALQKIPVGQTTTYGELAKQLKTSPRAVGNACRQNPIPIIIPCHRVVAKNHLGGYSGSTQGRLMNIKTWLLKHESKK